MIKFKKGEFVGGDLMDVIHFDFDDSIDNWWDYPLSDECYVLRVKEDRTTSFFSVNHFGISHVPRVEDTENEFWEMFWKSEVTMVFGFKDTGLKGMQNYIGDCVGEVRTLAKEILLLDEIAIDWQLYHELSGDIDNSEVYPDEELYQDILKLSPKGHNGHLPLVVTMKQLVSDLESLFTIIKVSDDIRLDNSVK